MKTILLILIRMYQAVLGPHLGGGCRFMPSCSCYAVDAIEKHGAWRGSRLAIRRICRCHPFHSGGYDPVPDSAVSLPSKKVSP